MDQNKYNMRKDKILKINIIITCIIILFLIFKNVIATKEKIAYINSYKVIQHYKGTKKATQQLMKKTAPWQANIDTLKSELQAMMVKYKRDSLKLSDKQHKLYRKRI